MAKSDLDRALRAMSRQTPLARLTRIMAVGAVTALILGPSLVTWRLHEARVVSSTQIPGKGANARLVVFEIDGRFIRRSVGDWLIPTIPGTDICVQTMQIAPLPWRWHDILHPGFCPETRIPVMAPQPDQLSP